ncbi:family 43 glycosylhydrolase [Paenibacillus allorhizosphaerae]|uniref:Ricin B lectin domain-containing protein n=1 Tax=Paenibacillus allorhizosphaerae TaxID=2849866 RepID=A0ABM8VF93_9BACL|nr:family 43 glycosylhydrolase [Paenibacillus allorhizosphaerae]CAG7634094.1 hypothetical protein PAECIP111802_02013 [Paenibacillus allorhizosphaerae]
MAFMNGSLWHDTSGKPIHAHGGGMLRTNGYFYWFGENREGSKRVSCYRSANLSDWEFRGDVLTLDAPFRPIETRTAPELITDSETGRGANIERPKVIYNKQTGKYVMWMHWENGKDYSAARCAIATCDTVDGAYVYHGSFDPVGHMSRDCTLFADDDGTAYFISAARDNADLHIYRLSRNYLAIDEHVKTLWPGQYREAPALVKRDGVYYMLTSGCTGWEPNQGKYACARTITGRWSELVDFGGPTTYDTQPTCILQVQGTETTSYLYIGDRWDPVDYHSSSYAILPLEFPDGESLALNWADSVVIDADSGRTRTERERSGIWRIRSGSHRYLTAQGEGEPHVIAKRLSYASITQQWMLESVADGYVRIRNSDSMQYLEPTVRSNDETGALVSLTDRSDRPIQQWKLMEDEKPGWYFIQNRVTGEVLTLNKQFDGLLHVCALQPDLRTRQAQRFLVTEHYGA